MAMPSWFGDEGILVILLENEESRSNEKSDSLAVTDCRVPAAEVTKLVCG